MRLGGHSSGSANMRAAAAFLSGALTAISDVTEAAGTATLEELRTEWPQLTRDMEKASKDLEELGVTDPDLISWEASQRAKTKGLQRKWAR